MNLGNSAHKNNWVFSNGNLREATNNLLTGTLGEAAKHGSNGKVHEGMQVGLNEKALLVRAGPGDQLISLCGLLLPFGQFHGKLPDYPPAPFLLINLSQRFILVFLVDPHLLGY